MEINKFLILILGILFLQIADSKCLENQIDINSATIEELDSLVGIGPEKANAIVDSRDYNSVDDLIDAKGVGEITLEKIKQQGLACVEEENSETEEEKNLEKSEDKEEIESFDEKIEENAEIKPIVLNAKTIKSEKDKEFSTQNLAIFGVILFGAVFGFLSIRKRKYKNEFN